MESQEKRIRKIVLERLGMCRVCHRVHDGEDVRVLSQKPDVWMMVVECPDCHSRSFVAAVVDERQADEAKIALRRLAGEQVHEALAERDVATHEPETEPLTEADVTEMATFLETFDGNFRDLFAKG